MTFPRRTCPFNITIPAAATHEHTMTATVTGVTIAADIIDDPTETIVLSGTVIDGDGAAVENIEVTNATFTIVPPLRAPTNVRVEVQEDDSWLIRWDDDQFGSVTAKYGIRYVVLAEDGTVLDSDSSGSSSDLSYSLLSRYIVDGRAYKIEVVGYTSTAHEADASP